MTAAGADEDADRPWVDIDEVDEPGFYELLVWKDGGEPVSVMAQACGCKGQSNSGKFVADWHGREKIHWVFTTKESCERFGDLCAKANSITARRIAAVPESLPESIG